MVPGFGGTTHNLSQPFVTRTPNPSRAFPAWRFVPILAELLVTGLTLTYDIHELRGQTTGLFNMRPQGKSLPSGMWKQTFDARPTSFDCRQSILNSSRKATTEAGFGQSQTVAKDEVSPSHGKPPCVEHLPFVQRPAPRIAENICSSSSAARAFIVGSGVGTGHGSYQGNKDASRFTHVFLWLVYQAS